MLLTEFAPDFVLFVLTAAVLVVGFIRTRRKVFLCALAALVLIHLRKRVLFICDLLTELCQRYVGLAGSTRGVLQDLATIGWLIALATAIYVVWRKPSQR